MQWKMTSDGLGMVNIYGTPVVWRGTLDWPLYGRYLNEGEDVARKIIVDRRTVGANIICCAGMLEWWPNLNPSNPKFWNSLRPFTDLAMNEGMQLCFVVFCDTRTLMPNPIAQYNHWDRFLTTLGDKVNVLFVGVNQPGHPTQQIDPLVTHKMADFPQLLCARDNPMESGNPVLPALDFSCYCSSRDTIKGVYEVGSSMHYVVEGWGPGTPWQGVRQASVLFEGPHFRPTGEWADPHKAKQLAKSLCFRGTLGGNYYSDQCSRAELLTGVERMCAVEFEGNLPTQ